MMPRAAVLVWLCACHAAGDAPVPVYAEPQHHLVLENRFVRVLDINVPPGHISRYHTHANPLVSVTLQDAKSWTQKLGEPRGPATPPDVTPSIGDNWDQALPYTHRVANVDTRAYRRIAAEWRASPGDECSHSSSVVGLPLVKDGRYGRVYEVRLAPHESAPVHVHTCPGLTVVGSGDQEGRWQWRDAGLRHELRNDGDRPTVIFEIDWR